MYTATLIFRVLFISLLSVAIDTAVVARQATSNESVRTLPRTRIPSYPGKSFQAQLCQSKIDEKCADCMTPMTVATNQCRKGEQDGLFFTFECNKTTIVRFGFTDYLCKQKIPSSSGNSSVYYPIGACLASDPNYVFSLVEAYFGSHNAVDTEAAEIRTAQFHELKMMSSSMYTHPMTCTEG